MDQRTRLLRVIEGKSVDRAPFICPGGMMNMTVTEVMQTGQALWPEAHRVPETMARLALAANRLAGVENVGVPFCMTVEAEAMGAPVEMGSLSTEPSIGGYIIARPEESERLALLDPAKGRARVCVEAVRLLKREAPDVPVIANLTGPVSLASSLLDPMVYYRALLLNKRGSHELMKVINYSLKRFGSALIEAGADVICIADPSATGEIMGRKSFAAFALPYINELVEYFRERHNVPAIVHICGNVRTLGGILAEIASEVISVDALLSIKALKELTPHKVTMGNVSTFLLARGDAARIRRSGEVCLQRGVDILAPACGVSPTTPLSGIRSLAQVVCSRD
jgi:[methyl-Co(III) methanol-specific corrinoid protein]:coenzyme M methyltransferase